jgi:enoyl-CoA hydratase
MWRGCGAAGASGAFDFFLRALPEISGSKTEVFEEERGMDYEMVLVSREGRVGVVTLNRPQALNALNSQLIDEIAHALAAFDADPDIGCMVLTGSEKAFAAGADIKEMAPKSYPGTYVDDLITPWDRIGQKRKPLIAAVAGFALGGGCEVAMMCDFIIAADNAKFGQPEIKLGVMPGGAGTQRLTRYVGKAKAMDMCLTGRMMDVQEAERTGLVSRIVPLASLMEETMKAAQAIAAMSMPIAMMTKESVNRSYETTLAEGIRFERRVFQAMFATHDQKEGMAAFVEKRPADFKHR